MKKISSYLLVLLLASAILLTISGANATLTKRTCFPEITTQLTRDEDLRIFLLNWIERRLLPEEFQSLKRSFIEKMAPEIRIHPSVLNTIIDITHEIQFAPISLPGAPCQHRDLPFSFCMCNNLASEYRYLLILTQIKVILEKHPPETTPQFVHTSFAEEGLLHTYCLAYSLSRLGYRRIHLNVIGNRILESVAKNIHGNEDDAKTVIKRGFHSIPGVTISVYRSAEDYENAVREGAALRSDSCDMVDYEPELQTIYSAIPLSDRLMFHNRPLNRVCATITRPEEVGPPDKYKSVFVFTGNDEKRSIEMVKELKIFDRDQLPCPFLYLYYYKLEDIFSPQFRFCWIEKRDIPRLLRDQAVMLNMYREKYGGEPSRHATCLFLILANKKSNSEIFTELMHNTRNPEEPLVAFEESRNVISVHD